ncbi:MAG: hypothetical protein ABIH86_02820 [Planctomycetota bacterium]
MGAQASPPELLHGRRFAVAGVSPASSVDQVPNTELMTYKVVALTRLACPRANIPSTTALATLNLATGREKGLQRGANILMPNVTPSKYRAFYEIYPDKACIQDTAEKCNHCMRMRIESIGRRVGEGAGSAIRKKGGVGGGLGRRIVGG